MKKRYLVTILLGAALLAWNCGENSSSSGTSGSENLPATSDFPYYVGGFTIDASTGAVFDAGGNVVGQLNPDGNVLNMEGNIILVADTTILPVITDAGFLVNKNGVVTDLEGNVIGSLNSDNSTITKEDGSIIDLSGNVIQEGDVAISSEAIELSSSSIVADTSATLVAQVPVGDVYSDLTVRDANGNVIGTFNPDTGNITLNDGSVVTVDGTLVSAPSSSSLSLPLSSAVDVPISSSSQTASVSSSSMDTGNITVVGELTQTVAKNAPISTVTFKNVTAEPSRSWNLYWLNTSYDKNAGTYTVSGTVPEYFSDGTTKDNFVFDGVTITLTIHVGAASEKSSSSIQAVSSSSSVRSSSSIARSSSSAKSSSSVISGSTDLEYISGGASGSGFATRYWDCCKPSCSWTENAGAGNEAKMCSVNGSVISDKNAESVCLGGSAATCTSQIPIIVNDNLAYAFAAVPASNGGQCGHCYALTFDGTGKYETKANHKAIKGKILVVMASNVGTDVAQGQFDVMIPGGGVGKYNGCANMGWGDMGKQYGGLLSDCENEVGYSGDLLTLRKNCLTKKCNSVFAKDAVAKEGCLFLATWMQAAGNPNHTYREVKCPAALQAQY